MSYKSQSSCEKDSELKFTDLEKLALARGLSQVKGPLDTLYLSFLGENSLLDENEDLFPRYEKHSYIISRELFANHDLLVTIRSPLTSLFYLPMKLFKEAGPGGSQAVLAEKEKMGSPYTGVVLSLNEVVKPRATYKIIDEKHNLLFTYKDLSHAVFAKNLMGRWYVSPSSKELKAVVGSNPRELSLVSFGEGIYQYETKGEVGQLENLKKLFSRGKIMLKIPKKSL